MYWKRKRFSKIIRKKCSSILLDYRVRQTCHRKTVWCSCTKKTNQTNIHETEILLNCRLRFKSVVLLQRNPNMANLAVGNEKWKTLKISELRNRDGMTGKCTVEHTYVHTYVIRKEMCARTIYKIPRVYLWGVRGVERRQKMDKSTNFSSQT